jgi:hypothetical protein
VDSDCNGDSDHLSDLKSQWTCGRRGTQSTFLGGEEDLFKVSYSVVFSNVLTKLRHQGSRLYPFLHTVVPHFVLLVGLCKTMHSKTQHVATATSTLCSISSIITAPLTASVTVPADHPLNADVLAWLSKNRSGLGARTLTDPTAQPAVIEREDGRGHRRVVLKPSAVASIPSYGNSRPWTSNDEVIIPCLLSVIRSAPQLFGRSITS